MDVKVGSKEELEAEERLENKRIASAERKWKAEMKLQASKARRDSWLTFIDKNDGLLALVFLSGLSITVAFIVCAVKIVWAHYQ